MAVLAVCLFAVIAAAPPAGPPPKLDRRRLEAFASRFWKARPKSYFAAWDDAQRAELMREADQLGALPEGALAEAIDILWKPLKKLGPQAPKQELDTPFGKATWLMKGKGSGKGLVLGLHGGGEGAGSAEEATRWSAKDCIGLYPQGIRLVHDTWNTVHGERFLLTLIELAKVQFDIDPDRVYTMGFSMGGTGSWFMAGRHPDLLAASSPCAGVMMAEPKSQLATKDEVTAIQHGLIPNVRNLPMYYYIGLADRNCMPGTYLYIWDRLLALRAADPGGYQQIEFRTYEELAHAFPPGEPEAGIEWMGRQRREPYPAKIVWEYASDPFPAPGPDDPLGRLPQHHMYWLYCDNPTDNMLVVATREGNTFSIERRRGAGNRFAVYLNAAMIDVAQDVVLRVDGQEVYRGRPQPSLRHVIETLDARLDRRLTFDRRVAAAE